MAVAQTGSARLAWALLGSMNGSVWTPAWLPLHLTLAPFSCPDSPALSKKFTLKVSGALGPTGWTLHSPPSESWLSKYFFIFLSAPGIDFWSLTSSGDGGQELEGNVVGILLVWSSADFVKDRGLGLGSSSGFFVVSRKMVTGLPLITISCSLFFRTLS